MLVKIGEKNILNYLNRDAPANEMQQIEAEVERLLKPLQEDYGPITVQIIPGQHGIAVWDDEGRVLSYLDPNVRRVLWPVLDRH